MMCVGRVPAGRTSASVVMYRGRLPANGRILGRWQLGWVLLGYTTLDVCCLGVLPQAVVQHVVGSRNGVATPLGWV